VGSGRRAGFEMDFNDFVDTPRKQLMLAGSVFFLLIFPIYFAVMPTLIGDGLVSGGSSGISAEWEVSFTETPISLTESVNLGDGDSHDSFFDLETESNIGYVMLEISCNDNDDPAFNDEGSVTSDISQITGEFEDLSDSGSCGNSPVVTMIWYPTTNYTGGNLTLTGTENEIRQLWASNGDGVGTWAATLTAEINAAPVLGGIVDNDEDYDIVWTAMTYELVLTPVVEVEA